jgi:hypothetical protein
VPILLLLGLCPRYVSSKTTIKSLTHPIKEKELAGIAFFYPRKGSLSKFDPAAQKKGLTERPNGKFEASKRRRSFQLRA